MSCLSPCVGRTSIRWWMRSVSDLPLPTFLPPEPEATMKRKPSLHLLGVHSLGEQASPDPSEERKDPLGNALDDRRTQPAQTQEIRLRTLDDNLLDTLALRPFTPPRP